MRSTFRSTYGAGSIATGDLSAWVELHRRFSTNRTKWFHWVFDCLAAPEEADILELGFGTRAPGLDASTDELARCAVRLLSRDAAGDTGAAAGR